MKIKPPLITLIILLLLVTGCTTPGKKLDLYYEKSCNHEITSGDSIHVTYLGAGGYLMRRGADSLLLAPFFSNPGLLRVGLSKIKSKIKIIDEYLPAVEDVETILIGHSHYDHLMDVPYIAKYHATKATIYGNKTMTHLLAPYFDNRSRLVNLNPIAGERMQGQWVYIPNGNIRFMAIKSEHGPQFGGIRLLKRKELNEDLYQCPRKSSHWVQGQTFTFIIDFLGVDGTVEFRIHYQDAASNPPKGFPPVGIENIDLAILCAAAFHEVKKYPEGILDKIKPKHIIVGHWENFFRSYAKPPRTVPFTNIKKFIEQVLKMKSEDSDCYVPEPGACITYRINRNSTKQ